MNIKNFLLILIVSFAATILRFYIGNNFIISIIGSFLCGFIAARRLNAFMNQILLIGFCSCFTSFSGFIYFLYKLINQEDFIRFFVYLNLVLALNLFMMYFGFLMSRKIT